MDAALFLQTHARRRREKRVAIDPDSTRLSCGGELVTDSSWSHLVEEAGLGVRGFVLVGEGAGQASP